MKIKRDHITNSSSANFILYIDFTSSDEEKFKKKWNEFLNSYRRLHCWRYDERLKKYKQFLKDEEKERRERKKRIKDGTASQGDIMTSKLFDSRRSSKIDPVEVVTGVHTISHIAGTTFEICYFTSMFNSVVEDVPEWMIYLVMYYNMNPLYFKHYGFNEIRFSIEDDK